MLDLESGKWINRIPGLEKAQGVYYAPDVNVLMVTDGIGAVARMFAGDSLQPLQTVKLSADREYVTYDPATKRFLVAHGGDDAGRDYGEIALNRAEHRLYIATRNPGKFFAYDTDSGRVVASMPTVGGADDMFFDEKRRQVYVSGGDVYSSVVKEEDADHYRDLGVLPHRTWGENVTVRPRVSTSFTSLFRRRGLRAPS